MPLYDFKCKRCGNVFEVMVYTPVRLSLANKANCPECEGVAERQFPLISNTPSKWGENGARESLSQ